MKVLIIGGNRFVGLRLSHALEAEPGVELHILNRTGFVPHVKNAILHKGDRRFLAGGYVDRDWDFVFDFACFNEEEAKAAVSFFRNVNHYIFISSASVYDSGVNLSESAFAPDKWNLGQAPAGGYTDGKRRAEAVFAQLARFPVLSVRFPFLLGPDDYTQRLDFHVQKTLRGEPIYIPNPAARVSMLNSEDATGFLLWATRNPLSGPLNVASAQPISLKDLMAQIELVTGKSPVLAKTADADNHSPYGVDGDFSVSTKKLSDLGFNVQPILNWLPGLIGTPVASRPKGYVH